MGGYPSVLVGSVSVCHFKLMNRLTHGPRLRESTYHLGQESMKPSKLKQHFKSCHGELVEKSVDYFRRKAEHLKNRRLDSGGMWPRQNKALLDMSYRIAFRIAQSKKSHTISEELIKPCLIEATTLVLGKEKDKK